MTTITFPIGRRIRVRARCDDDATWHVESQHELGPYIEDMLNTYWGKDWRGDGYEPYGSFLRGRAAAKDLRGEVVAAPAGRRARWHAGRTVADRVVRCL